MQYVKTQSTTINFLKCTKKINWSCNFGTRIFHTQKKMHVNFFVNPNTIFILISSWVESRAEIKRKHLFK